MKAFALLAAVALAQAGGQDEAAFAPSSKWLVDSNANGCTLSRSFTRGDETVTLWIMPLTGGSSVKFVLISSDKKRFGLTWKASITPEPGGLPRKLAYYSMHDKNGRDLVYIRGARGDQAAIADAAQLTIAAGGPALTLPVPKLAKAIQALGNCEGAEAKSWGFDSTGVATAPVPIRPQDWFTSDDYPSKALAQGVGGETNFRVTVDADGKPTDCTMVISSMSPDLDEKTCARVMARGRFKPARDTQGRPVRWFYANLVRWWMPG